MINLFNNISDKNINKILKILNAHTITSPEKLDITPLIDADNTICYIKSGSIQINKFDYNGNKIKLEELYEYDSFLPNISYTLDEDFKIISNEPVTLIILNIDHILNKENYKYSYFNILIQNLFSIINDKIKEKNERIEILSKRSIRDKLLEYFKIISKKNGSKVIYLPFGFTDLASYLAIDRSAMSRELKYLKEEGLISINGKRITLEYIKR